MVINSRFIPKVPQSQQVTPNNPLTGKKSFNPSAEAGSTKPGESFSSVLGSKLKSVQKPDGEGLKVSKHAEMRLKTRNITLSDSQLERISDAVDKANQKGVKDSLVLMDDMAFVVNVKNRMVVTAANKNDLRESVFTNIDGAVIV